MERIHYIGSFLNHFGDLFAKSTVKHVNKGHPKEI
jgi:hypothetical protein